MKQVVVEAYCDLSHEGLTPATEEVTYEGRLLDVCDEHAEYVLQQIEALHQLFMGGAPVEAPKRGRPPRVASPTGTRVGAGLATVLKNTKEWRTCPICGHEAPTRSANGQHLKQNHDKKLGDFEWPMAVAEST